MEIHPVQTKAGPRPNGDSSLVRAAILAARHNRLHQITRPKTVGCAGLLWAAARDAVSVHSAHLAAAMPHRSNQQRAYPAQIERLWRAYTNTGGVYPMRLGQPQACAIELGAPTRP